MKTTFNLAEAFFELVNQTYVKELISGNVYKFTRPLGSRLQDVVVNCLPITGDDIQQAVVNINIHLPNLVLRIGNQDDNSQPDTVNFQVITDRIISQLEFDAQNWTDFDILIQSQSGPIPEPDLKEHFVNIRVQINIPNI